ncbi:hypothetical protein SLEP1_g52558 [Rubroshorea leprosula]|uniref:F-box domain-containing protein n=1 Tax=Rubroshorea leprosula TaxID=152421 RepID=A0AAV5M6M9_9ROSI|nr:hypothetical protein SLEP1_g52558 [Rubroshorea leprosula]
MKRSRRKNVGGVDRISDLPESIIHQIMSFLPAKFTIYLRPPLVGLHSPAAPKMENQE